MKLALLFLGLSLGGGLCYLLRGDRSLRRHQRWLRHVERIEQGHGIEQACVQRWPINKVVNEHAGFQTERLKKRA